MDNAHSIRRSYMISNVMCRGHRLQSFGFHMSIAEAKRALTVDSSQRTLLVEVTGIEPVTFCMLHKRSPS